MINDNKERLKMKSRSQRYDINMDAGIININFVSA